MTHPTHAEKLITRPNHPTPHLAWCGADGCSYVSRHETREAAEQARDAHQASGEEPSA